MKYIGREVSLISNQMINARESTITLLWVRSFGTEGRKVREIPPSSEIYDFAIFRGEEIAQLNVLEGSKGQGKPDRPVPAENVWYGSQAPPKGKGDKGPGGGKGWDKGYEKGYGKPRAAPLQPTALSDTNVASEGAVDGLGDGQSKAVVLEGMQELEQLRADKERLQKENRNLKAYDSDRHCHAASHHDPCGPSSHELLHLPPYTPELCIQDVSSHFKPFMQPLSFPNNVVHGHPCRSPNPFPR